MYEQKLSVADKVKAFEMHLNGHTYQEIADMLGASKQRIAQILPHERDGRLSKKECIYPKIRDYMQENGLSYFALAKKISVSPPAIINFLSGEKGATKTTIDKILLGIGLTYEEAFSLGNSKDGEVL